MTAQSINLKFTNFSTVKSDQFYASWESATTKYKTSTNIFQVNYYQNYASTNIVYKLKLKILKPKPLTNSLQDILTAINNNQVVEIKILFDASNPIPGLNAFYSFPFPLYGVTFSKTITAVTFTVISLDGENKTTLTPNARDGIQHEFIFQCKFKNLN